ncbi:MAG: nuclear transport factor 2 family protein [Leptolyngbya sp.]|nr:nuclear transport factor 2 family protein [Candidatus Melainabacteria bacterium]
MTRNKAKNGNLVAPLAVSLALCATFNLNLKAGAIEPPTAATTAVNSDFSLEPDTKANEKEMKEVESLLHNIETEWNAHNLDGVMGFYADDYINNDGLNKAAISSITKEFWQRYPDAKSKSKIKQVRVDGNFATVESRDSAVGTTEKENQDVGTKGELNSVSEGRLFLKKFGATWKIAGDRIDYEKVRVSFGLARQLNASFSAPEQVRSGKQFSAKVDLSLPVGLAAICSITNQPLKYPQAPEPDFIKLMRPVDGGTIERVMPANSENRNELLMATVGITNASRHHLMGLTILTRRMNVVPDHQDTPEVKTTDVATKADGDEKKADASAESKAKPSTEETSESAKDSTKESVETKTETKEETTTESKSETKDAKETSNKSERTEKKKVKEAKKKEKRDAKDSDAK